MASNKQKRNQFLNEISYAVAALRNAMNIADEAEWPYGYDLEEEITKLIDISNAASRFVQD